jgi:CRP/FNR family transcriptional regulator, anaerobic regulatory protein
MNKLFQYFNSLGLTKIQAENIVSIFNKKIILKKGDFFSEQGQICKEIGFVVKGMCRHFYDTENDEITRWIVLENEFVNSLGSFITQTPSNENIQAIKPTEIVMASKKDWDNLLAENEFARLLWTRNIEQLYVGMETRVFNLIALGAEERYQWMLKHQPKFNSLVPDKYVASMLGIKPRHMSRIRAIKK